MTKPKFTFNSKNRNPVKQFFITFPRSEQFTKEMFLETMQRFKPDYWKISKETHEDGSPHLHGIFRTTNKFSKAFILKYFKKEFPNDYKRIHVGIVRSIKHCLIYIDKEDLEPLTSGEYIDGRSPKRSAVAHWCRQWGYKTYDEMKEEQKSQQDKDAELHNKAWEIIEEFQKVSDDVIDFKIFIILNKLIDNELNTNRKDDITFLKKYLGIK